MRKLIPLEEKGARTSFMAPEPALGITKQMAKTANKLWMEQKVLEYWQNSQGMTHTKTVIKGPSKKRTECWMKLNRRDLRALLSIYTGHCRLNGHLHRIGVRDSPECRLCMEEDETVEHVMCYCPAGTKIRFETFGVSITHLSELDSFSSSLMFSYLRRMGLDDEI